MLKYSCREYKSISEPELLRLQYGEEGRGQLLQVHNADGFCIADFSWGSVVLPVELEAGLRKLIGRKVGILNLEGYRMRCLDC